MKGSAHVLATAWGILGNGIARPGSWLCTALTVQMVHCVCAAASAFSLQFSGTSSLSPGLVFPELSALPGFAFLETRKLSAERCLRPEITCF